MAAHSLIDGTDPAQAQVAPRMELARALIQSGADTSPAYPMQAIARAIQPLAGHVIQRDATSELARLYASQAGGLADVLEKASPGHPLIAAARSDNPLVQAMAVHQAGPALAEIPRMQLEKQRFDRPYQEMTAHDTAQIAEMKRQHDVTAAQASRPYTEMTAQQRAQIEEQRRQHEIAAGAPTVIPYGAGVMDKSGRWLQKPGITEGSDYDPNGPSTAGVPSTGVPGAGAPPAAGVPAPLGAGGMPGPGAQPAAGGAPGMQPPAETTLRRDPIKPPAMAGTTSDALAAEGERYALTGKLGTGFSNGRDPIQSAQARAIRSYGTALAYSRGITPQELPQIWQNSPRWAGWIMGADGRAVGALGTAVDHLGTARELFKALDNGDVQLFNSVKNKFKEQFGYDAPTSVKAVAPIVGTEVMKAVGAAGAGSADERAAIAKIIGSLGMSPAQNEAGITALEKLIAGQLRTKQRQADAIDLPKGKFEKLVGKRGLEVLGSIDNPSAGEGGAAPTVPARIPQGWGVEVH